jgi:hypothetical protein
VTPEDWARVRELFDVALGLDRAGRDAFLDEACAGHPSLREEVRSLLAAHDRSTRFIERPAFEAAADLLTDSGSLLEGRAIGPYIIRQEIGRGGMGVVYLADDTRLSRRVALKGVALRSRDDSRRERLRREARAAAALSHPGIATVYALEEIGDDLYLASEYVPGPTLRRLIASGPLPVPQVVDIAVQVARALAAAHAQGVVHRDLKPDSVVRTPSGVTKILDFGIARSENLTSPPLTKEGEAVGTAGYMAPEQIRGEKADFRVDLFAFGVLVYELASGSNPFAMPTQAATLARILEVDPAPLSSVCETSPPELDRIVAGCLRKSPGDRVASTGELVADLERLQASLPSPVAPAKLARDDTRHPGGAATTLWWWQFHQAIVSTVYVLMMYPAWRVRSWLPAPWGTIFLLAVLACAAAAVTLRLHLWFTSRFNPAELTTERIRVRPWTRGSDYGLTASLVLAALGIEARHPEFAMLLVAVGIAAAIASLAIEPTVSRAAFRQPEA